ncbi:16S rRNA (guanine(527)-N(7))-methyltransferase RsmG [Scardovia wiggsiae]|uniref:16S rRNA (guanine(527)-N(7))-methyltransferase RsmG n=1 Tax=Scardovia wiggsiae TaxID=230143 RepID=UPI003610E81A
MADQFDNSPLIKSIFRDSSERMEFFHKKLESEGVLRGIIGPRDVDILWERHIFNSAALLPYIKTAAEQVSKKRGSGSKAVVGDIGSGGGFPGIVLASTLPDISFFLIEPMERRCEWLSGVIDELDLVNAQVVRARTEELISYKKAVNGVSGAQYRGDRKQKRNPGRRLKRNGKNSYNRNQDFVGNLKPVHSHEAVFKQELAWGQEPVWDRKPAPDRELAWNQGPARIQKPDRSREAASEQDNGSSFDSFKRENPHFMGFDIVTCRAVAPMSKLSGMALPLLKRHGELIALKGKSAQSELNKAEKELKKNYAVSWKVEEAPVAEGLEPTHVVTVVVR